MYNMSVFEKCKSDNVDVICLPRSQDSQQQTMSLRAITVESQRNSTSPPKIKSRKGR